MGADAPQWLVGAFVDALSEVGVTADRAAREAEAHELIGMWNAPGRCVHNFRHLIHVLTLLDELSSAAHDPELLIVAAWYHGACVTRDSQSSSVMIDPSQTSAICEKLTRSHLSALGTPEAVSDRVVELLACMASHCAPGDDTDAQILVDADLGRLALSPQEFAKYRHSLREEYSEIDDEAYYKGRRRSVKALLSRENIFMSEQASAWEEVARSNLELELARIEEKLRALSPACLDEEFDGEDALDSVVSSHGDGEVSPVVAERDEDLIHDNHVTAQARVIKRRSLKLTNAAPSDDLVTTGVLPAVSLVEDSEPEASPRQRDIDGDLSSLESAVDTLGLV